MTLTRWLLIGLIVGVATYYGLIPLLESVIWFLFLGTLFSIDWMQNLGYAASIGVLFCIITLMFIAERLTRKKVRA